MQQPHGDDSFRVLILTPTSQDAPVLQEVLSKAELHSCICDDLSSFCEEMEKGAGAAIVAEEALLSQKKSLLARIIASQPEWSDFPIILMAGSAVSPDYIWTSVTGEIPDINAVVLQRPVLARTLLSAVRTGLRSRGSQYRVAEELRRRREAEESLQAANQEMQAFSYSVSHDLRAPLWAIKSFSEMLEEDYGDRLQGDARMYMDHIKNGIDRMQLLIDDMLVLSRVSRQEISPVDIDMSVVAEQIIGKFRNAEPQREVEVQIQPKLVVHADIGLVRIILENLLGNAWKYTSKSTSALIEFGKKHSDGKTTFFVRDSGVGFDMQKVDRIFQPFQRLHTESEFHGTGVGMATVEKAINRSGGKIWAEGEVGHGATFYFQLPS